VDPWNPWLKKTATDFTDYTKRRRYFGKITCVLCVFVVNSVPLYTKPMTSPGFSLPTPASQEPQAEVAAAAES
jgi:hypothetical protein